MRNCIAFLGVTIGLSLTVAGSVWADDNVREVQQKLRDDGFYSGELDGAYSTDLSAALSRYQVRNGLPISGQLDAETSKALGAKPAVGPSTAAAEQGSETWRRLRRGERRTSTNAQRSETTATEVRETSSPGAGETESSTETQPRSARAATTRTSSEETEAASTTSATDSESSREIAPRSARAATARTSGEPTEEVPAPPPTRSESSTEIQSRSEPAAARSSEITTTESASAPAATSSADEFSSERLRDYVAAYVLAGLDKNVGAETEFFADRVEYYDQGTMDRDKIRKDLKRYDEQWPERHFWVAGKINIEPQSDSRVRVTFPLGFKLRNANRQSSGKVAKTLVLERAGEDLQIVAVNERKSE